LDVKKLNVRHHLLHLLLLENHSTRVSGRAKAVGHKCSALPTEDIPSAIYLDDFFPPGSDMYHAPPHKYRRPGPPVQAPLPADITVNTHQPHLHTTQIRDYSTFGMAQSGSDQSQANSANSSQINTNNALTQPEQSPRVQGEVDDSGNYDIPGPPPVTRVWDNKIWKIEVRQHPLRARMCGFGDKVSNPRCLVMTGVLICPRTVGQFLLHHVCNLGYSMRQPRRR
jgi:hypothetical protein